MHARAGCDIVICAQCGTTRRACTSSWHRTHERTSRAERGLCCSVCYLPWAPVYLPSVCATCHWHWQSRCSFIQLHGSLMDCVPCTWGAHVWPQALLRATKPVATQLLVYCADTNCSIHTHSGEHMQASFAAWQRRTHTSSLDRSIVVLT